jgi:iron complex transport system permease protein
MSLPGWLAVKPWTISRLVITCAACAVLWGGVALICLAVGSTGWGWPSQALLRNRWPSVEVASIVGAALAAAGVAYQAVLRNPLAEPYLLGVSSGAMLTSYLAAMLGLSATLGQPAASFVGSLLALMLVLAISQRRGRLEPVTLLLVGVIVSSVCAAAFMLVYYRNLSNEVSFGGGGPMRFLVGGINTGLEPIQIRLGAIIIAVGWIGLAALSGQLNIATLSEGEAASLGVRMHRLRWGVMIIASLITGCAVAMSGPIGFVGLVCPHLARIIVGPDQRKLLPLATAMGAALLAAADAGSRALTPVTSGPLPVGVLTGMLGGPFFLFLLWRGRGSRGE